MLMKDTELERIVELDKKFSKKVDVLKRHYVESKAERGQMSRFG